MSAHTRIRSAGDMQRFVWRALRIFRWMTMGYLVSISGGDGDSPDTQVCRYLYALSRAGIVYRRQTGGLEAGARPRSAGTHLQMSCRCPVRPHTVLL